MFSSLVKEKVNQKMHLAVLIVLIFSGLVVSKTPEEELHGVK
jgi:hypothetical protein